jgi:hypothetical protein
MQGALSFGLDHVFVTAMISRSLLFPKDDREQVHGLGRYIHITTVPTLHPEWRRASRDGRAVKRITSPTSPG